MSRRDCNMKVAHFATFGPNQCGLYHTAKDLVMAERSVGIDARFIADDGKKHIDPSGSGTDGSSSQGGSFTTEEEKWAYKADILVRHTKIPDHLHNSGIPIVMALHGRPESSYRMEEQNNPIIPAVAQKALDSRYKAFLTFWPEYVPFWTDLAPQTFYVPATVDLEEFVPTPRDDGPIILISDIWRDDVVPLDVLRAAVWFCRKHGGKINIAAIPDNKSIVSILNGYKDVLGELHGPTRDIKGLYARSNILCTPHVIATRTIREALACGMKVVAGRGCKYTPYTANPMDILGFANAIEKCWKGKMDSRKIAEREFAFKKAGETVKAIFKSILKVPTGKRKVFVDIGAHLGESVRRFYREMDDAGEYEIYCFEPDMETFKHLDKMVGHIKNVTLINACASSGDGMMSFFQGQANQNEGGTAVKGKLTGGVQYDKPVKVDSVDFVRWFESVKGGYNIVKVNIEGGEYDLMEHMLANGMTGDINKLFVQLHAHKFEHGPQRQRFHQIEAKFWNESECTCHFTNKGFARYDV